MTARWISNPIASTHSMPLPYFGAFRQSCRMTSLPSQFVSSVQQLIPGELLGVVDQMIDGRERIDGSAEPSDTLDAGRVQGAGEVVAVRVEVPAMLHGQVMEHRAERRRDVVRLQGQRSVHLHHDMLDAVQKLRA